MSLKRVVAVLVLGAVLLGLGLAWWLWPAAEPIAAVTPEISAPVVPPVVAEAAPAPEWPTLSGTVLPAGQGGFAEVVLRGEQPRTLQADPEGHFDFGALPPGQVWVSASKEGQASEVEGPLFLGAGTHRQLELVLKPAASVSGTVVDAISRAAIPNAAVLSGQGAVRTDAAGRFTLQAVPRQAWLDVSARGYLARQEWLSLELITPQGGLEISLEPVATLEGSVTQESKPVHGANVWAEVAAGAQVGHRYGPNLTRDGGFVLETSGGLFRLAASLPDGTVVQGPRLRVAPGEHRRDLVLEAGQSLGIDGHVKRQGEPLIGAVLTAIDAHTQATASVAVSGPLGAFHFARLPVGQYVVQVRQQAFSVQTGPLEQTGEGSPWEIELGVGGVVFGRVVPAAAGVRVTMRSGDWAGPPTEVGTDAEGRFKFEGVPTGVLQLEAEGEGGSAAARAKAGDTVVLTLEQGLLVVKVVDDRGDPVSDYTLSLVPKSAGMVRRMPVLSPTGAVPVHLPKGPWQLSATAEGFADSPPQDVVVTPGRVDARLTLKRALPVKGSVHDAVTGLPIRGASVSSFRRGAGRLSDPGATTTTDGNGDFVLPAIPLPSAVQVRDPDHEQGWADVNDSNQRLDFKLKPGKLPPTGDGFFEYQGVGMMLGATPDGAHVDIREVYEGSPAESSGIRAGDILIAVGGQSVAPPPQEVVKLIQGPPGTLVTITVQRGGEVLDFVVRRKTIQL